MEDPAPSYEDFDANPDEVLAKVTAFAESHGLREASLARQFEAYLAAAQHRHEQTIADPDEGSEHHG